MPVLSWRTPTRPELPRAAAPGTAGAQPRLESRVEPGSGPRPSFRLFESCANPACDSGWLHLWRSRNAPIFEAGWTCSPACTESLLLFAVRRELDGRLAADESRPHRIPLGLVMLEQGWIDAAELRQALDAQKAAGSGRVGQWLIGLHGLSEQLVTRALGLQWSCPVLPLEHLDPDALAPLVPRLFLDAFGALPLRVAAGRLLYLGFADRLDPVLALALERMSGLRVESGLVRESQFRAAHTRLLNSVFPPTDLIEAASEPVAAEVLARAVERLRPVEARLVRVHCFLWLRLWRQPQSGPTPRLSGIHDVICSVGAH